MIDTSKKFLVAGAGKSGIGSVNLLLKTGADVSLYDGKEDLEKEALYEKLYEKKEIPLILGNITKEDVSKFDLLVLSPGISVNAPIAQMFRDQEKPVWSEIELAYQASKGRIAAITGTNGKTTTTALTGEIMKGYYESSFVVGNIGIPYTSVALDTKEDSVTTAEISSFQLETIHKFHPQVSAILNITPDHLNRHHTMEEYIRVKELIASNQTKDDFCILNYEDEELRKFAPKCPATVVFFSSVQKLEEGIFLDGENIVWKSKTEEFVFARTDELKLLGRHNHENVMAASAMAYCAGVPKETIREVIMRFTAVPHRIEFVEEINGVAYYNDSKGTNPDAAIKGIQAMNRPTLLIGGGYDKQSSYEEWIQAFDGKVKQLVLIGQTREKIEKTAHECGFFNTILAENLEEAVKICAEKAEAGDAVLLSPACASWGQFDNYEQRGDKFKEYVRAML